MCIDAVLALYKIIHGKRRLTGSSVVVPYGLALIHIIPGALHHDVVVIGSSTHILEQRIQLLLHGVYKTVSVNRRAVIPLQIVSECNLPRIASRFFLLIGIAPLGIYLRSYILQLCGRGINDFKLAGNNSLRIDGAVVVELLSVLKLEIVLKKVGFQIIHNLSIVIILISQLIPVTGHNVGITAVSNR